MSSVLSFAPIAAAGFGVPQFLPQMRKLRATRDATGVSWSWAALTTVNNAAWIAYFALSHDWSALVPSCSVTLLAGALTAMLGARQVGRRALWPCSARGRRASRPSGGSAGGWPWDAAYRRVRRAGRAVVWTAYRTARPSGAPPERGRSSSASSPASSAYGLQRRTRG